jgi:hypothetical protein
MLQNALGHLPVSDDAILEGTDHLDVTRSRQRFYLLKVKRAAGWQGGLVVG